MLKSYYESLQAGKPFDLAEATSQVFHGTEHSDERTIQFSENWIQWLAGQGYAPLMHTQNTGLIIDGGKANCGERSQILKTLAESAGKSCRFVGLNGHVVLEVKYQGTWRMADPDYGIAYRSGVDVLSDPASAPLVGEVLHERGYSRAKVDQYLDILQTPSDNVFLPIGQALSPRLFAIEVACQWLIWVLPTICVLSALALVGLKRRQGFDANRQAPANLRKHRSRRLKPAQLGGFPG